MTNLYPGGEALSASAWPIAHHDIQATDATARRGPTKADFDEGRLAVHLAHGGVSALLEYAMPVTVMETLDGVLWASSIRNVLALRRTTDGLELLASYQRGLDFRFHGAYAFVTEEQGGTYYTTGLNTVSAYRLECAPAPARCEIVVVSRYDVPGAREDEAIVGLLPVGADRVAFATTQGRLGLAPLPLKTGDAATIVDLKDLIAETEDPSVSREAVQISNSFSQCSGGGIYMVASQWLVRLQVEGDGLSLAWATRYHDQLPEYFPARLGRGSGSTPSVMGDGTAEKTVVITDGDERMRIRFFDAETGREVGSHAVVFDDTGLSTSEQSVAVSGDRAFVVNNWVGAELHGYCELASAFSKEARKACPSQTGEVAFGAAQYQIDRRTGQVTERWVNREVSCSTSIPAISEHPDSRLAYCVGRRENAWFSPWVVNALDWETGALEFQLPLGSLPHQNPIYAATEIGANGEMMFGVMGGVMRISNRPVDAEEKCSARGEQCSAGRG